MSYIILTSILAVFGVFVFLLLKQNAKSGNNWSLAVMIICVGIWATATFFENEIADIVLARILIYVDFIFALVAGYFLSRFCSFFTLTKKNKYLYIIDFLTILTICSVVVGYVIGDLSYANGILIFKEGPLYLFYAALLIFYILYGSFLLLRNYFKATGIFKLQLIYILTGLFISCITPVIVNLIFPLFGIVDSSISRLGIYGWIFFIGFTSYAILRYRLMDIRVIVRRSAVFTVLVALITAIYALIAYIITLFFQDFIGSQSILLNGIITAILVALGFEPLKKKLAAVTDKYLFKAEYNPQEVLSDFADKMSATLDLDILSQYLTKRLSEVFKTTFVSLFLLEEKKSQYLRVAVSGKPVQDEQVIDQKLFSAIFNYLKSIKKEKDIFIREEVKKINEIYKNKILDTYYETLNKYGINTVVPLYSQDKLVGIIFLGDKKSGDVFSQEDIKMLEIISGQSAVAMQNAQLFEEQKHFTEHLKIEVDKATKELKVANVQLKKLDQAKSDFISIASHQLRTPLTVIKGYLSMIDQGDYGEIPGKILLPLDRVSKSTARIIGLVEDLLNISRIESGRMQYAFEDVDANALVTEVFEELEMHAKNKGLKFTYIKPTKKIPLLKLDRAKIRETLMNLMDNAIKYTEKGFVKVSLEKLDGHVRFSVSDSGRGIAPDEMPQLFQKFSRIQGVQLVHTEGTGLGLYIAKEILLKHHAKIWAESEGTGKGSTFAIDFRV